ncbi:MAG: hypothetical protein M0Z52_08155 [Actinomycetota bacterium]|nr:hypothetical protein [Actinomycetota bacterium]
MIKKLLFLVVFIVVVYIVVHAFSGGKKAQQAVAGYTGQSYNVLQQAGSIENSALAARAAAQGSIRDFNRIANDVDPESNPANQKRFK